MFITFSGLDGAGKTTQIKKMMQFLKKNGYPVHLLVMYGNISTSAVLRRFLRKKVLKGKKGKNQFEVSDQRESAAFRNDKNRKEMHLTILRQFVYIIDLIRFSFKRFYFEFVKGNIIIADRYLYDSLANLEGTGRFSKLYTKLMIKIIPQPDVALLIDADPRDAFKRKPEYPKEYYVPRRKAYLSIFKRLSQGQIIAPDTIEATTNTIQYLIRHKITKDNVYLKGDKYAYFVSHILKTLLGTNDVKQEIQYLFKTPTDIEYMKNVLNKNITSVRYIEKISPIADKVIKETFATTLQNKRHRLKRGYEIIGKITKAFNKEKTPIICMKTIDNYPDIGHDIDFYTDAPMEKVDEIMQKHFHVLRDRQSFSDKLAAKKSYKIGNYPGVEMHCGFLGQVGEENVLSKLLVENSVYKEIEGIKTRIPCIEHSLIIRVLQRMYRHFNIRVTDVYNTVEMIKSNKINWEYLKETSIKAGVWKGVMQYIHEINRIYTFHNSAERLNIPLDEFLNKLGPITSRRMLFRFPLFSVGAVLYLQKFVQDLKNRNFYSFCRSNIIVPLAVANLFLVKVFKKELIW